MPLVKVLASKEAGLAKGAPLGRPMAHQAPSKIIVWIVVRQQANASSSPDLLGVLDVVLQVLACEVVGLLELSVGIYRLSASLSGSIYPYHASLRHVPHGVGVRLRALLLVENCCPFPMRGNEG